MLFTIYTASTTRLRTRRSRTSLALSPWHRGSDTADGLDGAHTQGKGTGVLAPPTASTGLASPSCVNRDRQRPAGSPARAATFPECHSLSSSLIPMLLLPLSLSDDINDRLLAKLRHLQMDGKQKQWLCRVRQFIKFTLGYGNTIWVYTSIFSEAKAHLFRRAFI